jgi:ribosomal protein S18 acetylase RimI-like enzyme
VIVRPALATDRDAVYDICLRTGDAGADATALLAHGELYGHVYAGAYLALAPELALVAELDGDVVGYVVGALDTAAFDERLEAEWWPALRARYPLPGDGTEVDRRLVQEVHRPFHMPAMLLARYPSHLHVNLLPVAQGRGVGRRMMDGVFDLLRDAGSPGVHLGVDPRNERAIGFYEHLGMTRRSPDPAAVLFTLRL